MRSSFDLALEILAQNGIDTGDLGLQIGLEYGPIVISRLGKQGNKIRCCISRAVIESENAQMRCDGNQTALGEAAYRHAPDDIKNYLTIIEKLITLITMKLLSLWLILKCLSHFRKRSCL